MKRLFATLTVTTLLLFSLAGCSKKAPENNPDTTPTPSPAVTETAQLTPSAEENNTDIQEFVSFGGNFINENASLSAYIGASGWELVGVCTSDEQSTVVLTGLLTYTEDSSFVYSDNDNEVILTYHASSLDVKVTKGTAYKGFEGTYARIEETTTDTSSPEDVTSQELLGRVALTHFTLTPGTTEEYSLDLSNIDFDNAYLNSFVLAYTDMYLLRGANIYTELSETTPYYALSKDSLNDLLLTATSGKVDLNNFTVTNSKIICKEDAYYIPCDGYTYGEVSFYPQQPTESTSSNTLYLDAYLVVAKEKYYNLNMTLVTSENASAGSTGMQIDTASFEQY